MSSQAAATSQRPQLLAPPGLWKLKAPCSLHLMNPMLSLRVIIIPFYRWRSRSGCRMAQGPIMPVGQKEFRGPRLNTLVSVWEHRTTISQKNHTATLKPYSKE